MNTDAAKPEPTGAWKVATGRVEMIVKNQFAVCEELLNLSVPRVSAVQSITPPGC